MPCNWLQWQENSIDPIHFEWQHDNYSLRQRDERANYAKSHERVAFEEFEHGFVYRRVMEGRGLRPTRYGVALIDHARRIEISTSGASVGSTAPQAVLALLGWDDLMAHRWIVWPKGTPIRDLLDSTL